MSQRKTIRSILSKRLSYRVLVKHLGIPDLVDIIQDYAAQCEFRILNVTVPGFNKYLHNVRDICYDESRGLLFHMKPLPNDKVTTVCYNLLGNPVDAFPNALVEECLEGCWHVAFGRFIVRNRKHTYTIIEEYGHRTVLNLGHQILAGISSRGLWLQFFTNRNWYSGETVLSLYPWESLGSMETSVPLHTARQNYSCRFQQILDDNRVIFRWYPHHPYLNLFHDTENTSKQITLTDDYPACTTCNYTMDLCVLSQSLWRPAIITSHDAIVTRKHSNFNLELGKWAQILHFDILRGILIVLKANCEIHVYY
jgi:hypothetical protein